MHNERLIIIDTLDGLEQLSQYIDNYDLLSFDTETTGVKKDSLIIGFSVGAELDVGYYVILSKWDKDKQMLVDLETKAGAAAFLQKLVGKKLVTQNGIFDCSMVWNNFKIDLVDYIHTDTLILGHLLDENRRNGLKELGVSLFGEDAKKEQDEVKASVHANGGVLTKNQYELYKADAYLLARYGAKDAILTLKVMYTLFPQLEDSGLLEFYYDDESMPLFRGPTYDLNTTGLKVDTQALQDLKGTLEIECHESKSFIHTEIAPHVKDKYKGDKPKNTFNIGSKDQMAWLLFEQLGNTFHTLTKGGKELCKALDIKIPYSDAAKRDFIRIIEQNKGRVYEGAKFNHKTKKMSRPKKVKEYWCYLSTGKETLKKLSIKYKWVEELLKYAKNLKLLNTYVIGIQERMEYGIIRPSFLQHGTTSGRYSSKNPNFQNLPRDDKRVKKCIVSRPGKIFVGSDYSQLEPRVFASFSGDERLLNCFKSDDDFYSVIGMETFDKFDCTPKKDGSPDAFGIKYKKLRDISKAVALAATYGTTASRMATIIGNDREEAQEVINSYFLKFPKVKKLMFESHELAKRDGQVTNLFGRPRRMPQAQTISKIYGKTSHEDLPYEIRNLLNLAINHRIQSTGASIMNRAAIAIHNRCKMLAKTDQKWSEVKLVLQVHDELILEGPESLKDQMIQELKHAMENTVVLPGVELEAEPKAAFNLADLK